MSMMGIFIKRGRWRETTETGELRHGSTVCTPPSFGQVSSSVCVCVCVWGGGVQLLQGPKTPACSTEATRSDSYTHWMCSCNFWSHDIYSSVHPGEGSSSPCFLFLHVTFFSLLFFLIRCLRSKVRDVVCAETVKALRGEFEITANPKIGPFLFSDWTARDNAAPLCHHLLLSFHSFTRFFIYFLRKKKGIASQHLRESHASEKV